MNVDRDVSVNVRVDRDPQPLRIRRAGENAEDATCTAWKLRKDETKERPRCQLRLGVFSHCASRSMMRGVGGKHISTEEYCAGK